MNQFATLRTCSLQSRIEFPPISEIPVIDAGVRAGRGDCGRFFNGAPSQSAAHELDSMQVEQGKISFRFVWDSNQKGLNVAQLMGQNHVRTNNPKDFC
jgi:hypothetical protein